MIARRTILFAAWGARFCFGQTAGSELLRGRLIQTGSQPAFQLPDGRATAVSGDEPTGKILRDARLGGRTFEATGRLAGPGRFEINPIETRSLVVFEGTRARRVTYYCDVCSIRTYSPGPCMCCQAETRLDLIDPAAKE